MQSSSCNKNQKKNKQVPKIQCIVPQLPIDVYRFLAEKINDIDTLINYFNTCTIFRETFLLVRVCDTNFLFTGEIAYCKRTFTTYLEYLHSNRFVINILNFKSFRVYGFVTNLPLNLLIKITFSLSYSSSCPYHIAAINRKILDHGSCREIVFDDSKSNPIFKCKAINLYFTCFTSFRISLCDQSEFLLGRNDIYKEIDATKILHTASINWDVFNTEYIFSFYTGLPRVGKNKK